MLNFHLYMFNSKYILDYDNHDLILLFSVGAKKKAPRAATHPGILTEPPLYHSSNFAV